MAAKFIRQAGCSKLGFPTRNRPETLVAVAECGTGSGGTNPARRFWTRLPVVLRPRSNSIAIVSPFISEADQTVKIRVRSRFLHFRGRWSPKPEQGAPWL